MKLVEVVWIDSEAPSAGWLLKSDFDEFAAKPIEATISVGYLHWDSEEHLVLFQSLSADAVGCALKIPRIAVQEVRELAEKVNYFPEELKKYLNEGQSGRRAPTRADYVAAARELGIELPPLEPVDDPAEAFRESYSRLHKESKE